MASTCNQCGAALTERDAFCTKCGAQRNEAAASAAARRFCTKCGAPFSAETNFCTKCGAPTSVAGSSPVVAATSSQDSAETSATAASTSAATGVAPQAAAFSGKSAAGIPKGAIIGGAIVVLVILAVAIAGSIYAAHRAKERAAQGEAISEIDKSPAGPKAAAEPGQYSKTLSAIDDFSKKLHDLQMDAPDQKTSSAVNDLDSKLDQLTLTAERNVDNPAVLKNVDKSLGDLNAAADKLVTTAFLAATDAALTPPPVPSGPSMVPVAGTGDPKHDWPLEYERTVGGPEADLVVRTGDVNNLGFGWPSNFDPFSGKSTPPHPWPNINQIPPQAPAGTDRIIIGTGVTPVHMHVEHIPGKRDRIIIDSLIKPLNGDGYSSAMDSCYEIAPLTPNVPRNKTTGQIQLPPGSDDSILRVSTQEAEQCTRERQLTMPTPIVLDVGDLPAKINTVLVQIFADDFQAPVYHSHFQVSLNGTRIPTFEYVINSLDQSGPIGKLVTMRLLPEYWPLLKSGTVKLLIDDPTTHVMDGYAIDFVRILVNPHKFKYQVSLSAHVTDADTHKPITGATVTAGLDSAATDKAGKCELNGIPAGLVVAMASAPGYDENSVPVDLPAGQAGSADIQLHRHQETTAALEQSIAQTGSATIYGIHFDTNSPNFRSDSLPALNAVLGLIHNHPGSKWLISGHTDNQGNAAHNQTLSVARAKSVVAWLKQHGVDVSRLEPQGFGATRPVADNATANGRFLNRRVEVALAK